MELQEYLNILFEDRLYSWSYVVSAYLILTLVVRKITFGGLRHEIRYIEKKTYKQAKRGYQEHALPGWIVYLVSVFVLAGLWLKCFIPFLNRLPNEIFYLTIFALFFISIIMHLKTFFRETIHAVKKTVEEETES